MRNIIIDTDPGIDDALAMMLAVKSGLFDIVAITTVAGNSGIENTTKNARYILKLLEREDIPICSGAEKPLKRDLISAVVHGESGLAGIDVKENANLTGNAVDKIIEIVDKEETTIIALGPLTNIALAIQKAPEIMKKVKEIFIMGGAIRVPGNENRVAEFNIFVDPEAAERVFNFPIKKTLIPLDACNAVKLQLVDFEKIRNEKLKGPILCMMGEFIRGILEDAGVEGAVVYDALAVYSLINPEACIKNDYDIRIETQSELTRGMSVADLREKSDKKCNVSVVESIDEQEFKKDFIEILSE